MNYERLRISELLKIYESETKIYRVLAAGKHSQLAYESQSKLEEIEKLLDHRQAKYKKVERFKVNHNKEVVNNGRTIRNSRNQRCGSSVGLFWEWIRQILRRWKI